MSAKASLHFDSLKSFDSARGDENERRGYDQRKIDYKNLESSNHYDYSRRHLNFEVRDGKIVPLGSSKNTIRERLDERLRELGVKEFKGKDERNRPNIAVDFIIGGDRTRMREMAFGNQNVMFAKNSDNSHLHREKEIEQFALDTHKWLCRRFGEKNIISFCVHLDETTPHIHALVVPSAVKKVQGKVKAGEERKERERLSFSGVFGTTKEEYASYKEKMHTDFFLQVGRHFGLQRGDLLRDLPPEQQALRQHREKKSYIAYKKTEEAILKNTLHLRSLKDDIRHAEIRLKGLQSMISNLENQRADIESAINDLNNQLHDGTITQEQMTAQMQKLLQQKEEVERKLADKEEKLKTATEQLNALADKRAKANKEYMEVRQNINKELPRLQDKVLHDMSATYWEIFSKRFDRMKEEFDNFRDSLRELDDNLSDDFENLMEKTGLDDVARAGNEIIAVGTALYLGYIDQATNYAVSHGGGGSSPGGGWGRDKDDDDERWRFKCLLTAAKMMRPAGQKVKKSKGIRM